jgi:hypothetical protein
VFTASWIAAPSDGHTQQVCFALLQLVQGVLVLVYSRSRQGFSILGHGGQLQVDQTHRGYTAATHGGSGLMSINPL